MLMHSIREILAPRSLIISSWTRGETEVNPDSRGLKPVVGWLVWLAMSYGTTKLWVGVKRDSGESWMKFFGPRWHRNPRWWDLVPPEPYCYPTMLQVCLCLAKLNAELPIRGVIPAILGGRRLILEFSADEIESFQISWDEKFAWDKQLSGIPYPDENPSGDQTLNADDNSQTTCRAPMPSFPSEPQARAPGLDAL